MDVSQPNLSDDFFDIPFHPNIASSRGRVRNRQADLPAGSTMGIDAGSLSKGESVLIPSHQQHGKVDQLDAVIPGDGRSLRPVSRTNP